MTYEALIEQLSDASEEVRETVCWTLGELGYLEAGRRIARIARHDACLFVRMSAVGALARMHDLASVATVASALEDPEPLVRMAAVSALGQLRDPKAVDPLKRALERDENSALRDPILAVLLKLTGVAHRYLSVEEKKIEKYRAEVQASPENGHAHYNLAVAYFHHREYRLAHEHCEAARTLGTGIAWLRRRLDELPPAAIAAPAAPAAPAAAADGAPAGGPSAGPDPLASAGLEGELAFDSGEVPEAADDPDRSVDDGN
jgi:hypothetical protein